MKKFENTLSKNLFASLLAYGLSFGISFFLTPYITKVIGVEANGFVTLANQFIGYITLITTALTSMASRFISIELFNNRYDKASVYFSSVFIATGVIGLALCIPVGIVVFYLENIIQINADLIADVKFLFVITYINFLVGMIFQVFTVATYVTNRLYLNSLRTMESTLLRGAMLLLLYIGFEAKMHYVALAALVCSVYTYIWQIHYTKKFLSEMTIRKKYFKFAAIKELISSGAWNIVIQLNNILNTGLDLLLSNLFLGEELMGILAVAKTIPTAVSTMLNSVSGVFLPEMTKYYAEGDISAFMASIRRSIKILGMMFNVPVVFLIVYGTEFYHLWQPSLDSRVLSVLSLLTIVTILVSGSTAAVFGIFTITNKLRYHSVTSLLGGVLNVILVICGLLLVPTGCGIYLVAGISTLIIIIRNYLVTFPYAARCVGQKWFVFHVPSFQTILGALIASVIVGATKFVYRPDTWFSLVLCGAMTAVISVVVNALIVLSKQDRQYCMSLVKNKLSR